MKHESCPELYTCPRVKMTPLIRVLLRCTAAEAMESICTSCASEAENSTDNYYVSPSGRKVEVMFKEEKAQRAKTLVGS